MHWVGLLLQWERGSLHKAKGFSVHIIIPAIITLGQVATSGATTATIGGPRPIAVGGTRVGVVMAGGGGASRVMEQVGWKLCANDP